MIHHREDRRPEVVIDRSYDVDDEAFGHELFRTINHRLRELGEIFGFITGEVLFVCECPDRRCLRTFRATLEEYDDLCSRPWRYALAPLHAKSADDHRASDTSRFVVSGIQTVVSEGGVAEREDDRAALLVCPACGERTNVQRSVELCPRCHSEDLESRSPGRVAPVLSSAGGHR